MAIPVIIAAAVLVLVLAFWLGRARGAALRNAGRVHSVPAYHGAFVMLAALVPLLVAALVAGWLGAADPVIALAAFLASVACAAWALSRLRADFAADIRRDGAHLL